MPFEHLQLLGSYGLVLNFRNAGRQVSWYPDGRYRSAQLGTTKGLRSWTLIANSLPNDDASFKYTATVDGSIAEFAADYMWNFYERNCVQGAYTFSITDPRDGNDYNVVFDGEPMSLTLQNFQVYATNTGFTLLEVRTNLTEGLPGMDQQDPNTV